MAVPSPRLDAAQFDRVAATCRWADRSIAVVRALLVDGATVADVATAHQMSKSQARILRARFIEKADKHRERQLDAFIALEPPKLANPLDAYADHVRTLRAKGYTIEQIVSYFKTNGIATSAKSVRKFLRSLPA